MAFVFILLAAGFLFTMNNGTTSRGGLGSGPTVLEVYGRSLDQQEYSRIGARSIQLASSAGLYFYVQTLSTSGGETHFVANRLILQKAIQDLGVYASDDAVSEAIKKSPAFTQDGKFNEAAYTKFVDRSLGRLGMTERDLRELFREDICLKKIIDIIGGGLITPKNAMRDLIEAMGQTVTLARIEFKRDDFVEKENPSEEEIKAYWEAHQDAYKTEEKRRINYFLLTTPKTPIQSTPPKLAPNATEAEKAAALKAQKEELKLKTARALKREMQLITDQMYDLLDNKKTVDLGAILKEYGYELKKSELFTQKTLPKEIANLQISGSVNRGRSLAQEIFSIPASKNHNDMISDELPVGDNGWIIFTVEEIIEPTLLDYAAARDKARAQLIGENADKKVKAAAEEARSAILALMKSGKSFEEAAKEKGLTPMQVGPYSISGTPPKNEPSFRQLHQTASELNPGDVSEVITEPHRALFIYVAKREIEDTEELKHRAQFAAAQANNQLKYQTFINWMNHQYEKAGVKSAATMNN